MGEYNGKFMSGQMVMEVVCIPRTILEKPINFYRPEKRWCFGGIRLADDY